ncbi:hypothetical protein W02_26240 [Nitrospira sp. KM1]|nr:hypothetical protein W02_26240 [Nitrospira sp. KM1]
MIESNMDKSPKECTRCEDHGPRVDPVAAIRDDSSDPSIAGKHPIDGSLADRQPILFRKRLLHCFAIEPLVTLGPQGSNGRPLARIDQPELNAGSIGISCHFAA